MIRGRRGALAAPATACHGTAATILGQVDRRPVPLFWYESSINFAVGCIGAREGLALSGNLALSGDLALSGEA